MEPKHTNPNCDGQRCLSSTGDVRFLPTGGSSNAILCKHCFEYELEFRRQRNKDLADSNAFKLPTWESLRIDDQGK